MREAQARRSIIQAESVRRIPCRLRRKQATDFMLLSFGVEIRSFDRLEVGRNLKSDEHHDVSQQNIILTWQFAETLFLAIDPEPNKTPNCGAHLLPTCYNFEFEGRFSTT